MAPARIFADAAAAPLGRSERRPLNQAACATRSDGSLVNLTVVDLSNDGCGIFSTESFNMAERVELMVIGRGKVSATVRWVDGGRAGLSFVASDPASNETPRQHERVPVAGEVAMRRAGKLGFRVNIFDLSPDGCSAEFVDRPEIGEQLWIKFDGMEALEAKVRWIAGARAGLKFARPLYVAVFDAIVGKLKAAA